jgi:periplasmic protein TonB
VPPQLISKVDPVYPILARMAEEEGVVTLGFVITEQGTVEDPVVLKADNALLANAALEAILQWTFRPGLQDGRPVPVRSIQSITFSLRP